MGGKPLNRGIINERLKERGIVMLDDYERHYIPARFQCPSAQGRYPLRYAVSAAVGGPVNAACGQVAPA